MNSIETIRTHLVLIRELLDTTVNGCDAETLQRVLPGATIGSIGSIYAHAAGGEDWGVQAMIQGKPQVLQTGGWVAKLGVPMTDDGPDWNARPIDLALLQGYIAEVRAATDAYLAGVIDADLDRQIDWFGGRKESVGWVLSDTVLMHVPEHAGEISALRGVMGQQGLPY